MNKTKFFSSLLVAALFASTSVFTSCKDYDDDIKNLQEQINARAMQTDLESLKTSLQSELTTVKQSIETKTAALNQAIEKINGELATKASAADLNALTTKVNAQAESIAQLLASIDALTAKDAALQTQIDAINAALDEYAKKKDLEDLAAKYTALKGDFEAAVAELKAQIATEKGDREAADAALQAEFNTAINGVKENLKQQQDAFDAYKAAMDKRLAELEEKLNGIIQAGDANSIAESFKKINEEIAKINSTIDTKVAELNGKIAAVDAKLADYAKTADVNASLATLKSELKGEMETLSQDINKVQDEVNVLNAFIDKQLTSLVLMPDFYWEGLEAFEAPALIANVFEPIKKDYKFSFTVSSESRPYYPYYPVSSTLGDSEIKVTVPVTMGFVGDDGKTYGCEDEKTWNEESRTKFLVTSVTPYTDQAEGENVWMSLNNADGKNLMPATVNPEAVAIQNGVYGIWHYNPATADLKGWKVNFFGNIAAHYTRGNEFASYNDLIGATPFSSTLGDEDDANIYLNGMLVVPFKVNYAYVLQKFAIWAGYNNTTVADGFGGTVVEPDWADRTLNGSKIDYAYGPYGPYPYLAEFDVIDNRNAYGTSVVDGTKLDAYLPFVALQLEKGDTTVTSDYGVVVPAVLNIVALADNAPEAKIGGRNTQFSKNHAVEGEYYGAVRANHLYESVGYNGCKDKDCYGAIPMPATHSVAYDGSIDLNKFVETHFDYTSFAKYGTSTKDQIMSASLMKELGLKYQFSIVDYYLGNEKTSESAHIEEGEEGVFYPRSVNADGTTIKGETATREVIDREPLIRVDLVDADGEIVRYGYIKLRITENAEVLKDVEVTINLDKDLYMNCGDSVRVTWAQMENLILRQLNLKKSEFEDNYYMENVGKHEHMPHANPANPWTEAAGGLYTDAAGNKFYAVRYAKAADGAYAVDNDDDDLANLAKYNNTSNWFGRVWYTPHDNATTSQDWDNQTNVLIWNISEPISGNMTANGYYKLREAVGATYASQGKSTKDLSTVVRFVNKNNGTSVWVTLVIPAGKIHFPYADIANRDLGHWYDFQTGYARETADTIEVYANVPTPAEVGRHSLDLSDDQYTFEKNLNDFWLRNSGVFYIHEAGKYGKLKNNVQPMFQFRLPKKGESAKDGVNSIDEDASKDSWTVKGISGSTYTLKLAKGNSIYNTQIVAVKRDGKDLNEIICTLDPASGKIRYMGRTEEAKEKDAVNQDANDAATDILNYMGMYDQYGKLQKDSYLSGQNDKTFTAYVEIHLQSAACIDPLIDNNYFNVRFLRPINAWAGEKKITDAPNKTQFINIWELLYIRDWRQYAVVMDGKTQKFLDDNKDHKGDFAEGNVTYGFYNITNLYVDRKDIRSDHYLTEAARIKQTDPAEIQKLRSVTDIPSLTSVDGSQYLKIIAAGDAKDSYTVLGTAGKAYSTASDDVLAYTNNGGVVQPFHIYVPISIEYSWGAVAKWTQKVWAVITVDPTIQNN